MIRLLQMARVILNILRRKQQTEVGEENITD